jgi:hypothetical protein
MDQTYKLMAGQYPDLVKFEQGIRNLVEKGYFQQNQPILINRTPGRLDLMGGNDDYTGGLVFETTIREATFVGVQPRSDQCVQFYNPAVKAIGWKEQIEFSLADLMDGDHVKPLEAVREWINQDPKSSWCAYILGDLYFLLKKFPEKVIHGLTLYLESDVPLGKGVSSSAALEVAPMKAMAAMYGIRVEGVQLAEWTQWVEIGLTQSACGIMDQFSVVMGDEGYFVPMLCQPCQPKPLVKLPETLRWWSAIRWRESSMNPPVRPLSWDTDCCVIGKTWNLCWMRVEPCPGGLNPNGTGTWRIFPRLNSAPSMKPGCLKACWEKNLISCMQFTWTHSLPSVRM